MQLTHRHAAFSLRLRKDFRQGLIPGLHHPGVAAMGLIRVLVSISAVLFRLRGIVPRHTPAVNPQAQNGLPVTSVTQKVLHPFITLTRACPYYQDINWMKFIQLL